MEQQRDAASLGMWLFLATEIMFFGGMFCAYLIYRFWYYNEFAAGSRSARHLAGNDQHRRADLQQLDGGARGPRRADGQAQAAGGLLLWRLRSFWVWPSLGSKESSGTSKFEEHHIPGSYFRC